MNDPLNAAPPGRRRLYGWVLSFLRPYKHLVAASCALGALTAGVSMLIPKSVQLIVDDVLPDRDLSRFRSLLVWLSAAAAALIAASVAKRRLESRYQTLAAGDMQLAVFEQLRRLGYPFYERHPAGDTLSLFHHELAHLERIHKHYLPGIAQLTIGFLVSFGFMLALSWPLSLAVFPGIALYYAFGPCFERRSAQYASRLSELHAALNKQQYDSVAAVPEVRAYGREAWELERLLAADRRTADTNVLYFKLINYRGAFRRIAVYASGVLPLAAGYWLNGRGQLTVGSFAAFMLLYYKVMFDLTVLITNVTEQKVLLVQTERLQRFMAMKPEVEEPAVPMPLPRARGSFDVRGVTFAYPDGAPVLQDVTLRIRAGEKVAFVGTSGHGKSTLVKLLGRLYDPTEGAVELDGVPLRRLAFDDLRRHIGYVFQETYLFGASAMANIRFARPDASDEEVIFAARAASAHDFIVRLPQGYDTQLGERGNRLSGGQKQRISIARAILRSPAVLILDEATSALDNETEAAVKRSLDLLFADRTIVAVAHRLSTIRDFDTIHVVEDGRIVESGSYEELVALGGSFCRLTTEEETNATLAVDF